MKNGTLPSAPQSGEASATPRSSASSPAASHTDATIDFPSIVATLVREKWIILATCLLVAGAIAAYTFTVSPVYQASSMVRIDQQNRASTNLMNTATVQQARDLTGEIGVLRNSLELARRVTKKLRTADESDGGPRTFPVLVDAETEKPLSESKAARRVLKKVEFTPHRSRNMIEIVAESKHPEEAATIANIYAEAYKRFSREKARAGVEAARKFLETQAEKQREKIRRLEQRWESFAENNRLLVQGKGGERLASKYNKLKARRDKLAFKLKNTKTQLELLRQQLRQFRPQLEESVLEEQEQSGLKSEIRALEDRIATMRAKAAKYYAANPNLEGDTTRIQNHFPELAGLIQRTEALEKRKRTLTQQLIAKVSSNEGGGQGTGTPLKRVSQLRSRIAEKELATNQLQAQLSALDAQIDRYKSRLDNVPQQRVQREQIERKLKQAESFYKTIMGELQKTTIAEEAELGHVEVVQSAFVPGAPVRPNVKQNLLLGLLLGIGVGVGVAFLKEATNTQLRRPDEVEERGYSLLGAVPAMDAEIEEAFDGEDFIEVAGRQVSTRLMPALNPWSSVTENYRLIQTNLEHSGEESPSVVFVTSAQPGEGKTTTAVNLALTGALSGQRVLLIDADMRTPTSHKVLGKPRTPGLADLLEQVPASGQNKRKALRESTAAENALANDSYMHRPLVDGLYYIPAGETRNAPTKMHDSKRLRCFVEAAQPHFDRIFIDTPPTRAASDAIVIGGQANATALVVSSSEADGRALDSTMKALRTVDADVSGVVFNRFDEREAKTGGTYDYSYYDSEDYYGYQNGGPEKAYQPA